MTKNLKISLILLCILIGIYFINNKNQNNLITKSSAIFLDDPKDILKILIQKGDDAIELIRVDTTWKISGNDTLIIKTRSLDNFFDKVLTVKKETIISENPNKYEKFSVSDSLGTHLALINLKNETSAYYVFGRSKSDYSRSYVRIGENPKVYLTNQNVIYMLSTNETYWGEKPKEEIPPPDSPSPLLETN